MTDPKMPEGLERLPDEYQNTNEGIERLIKLISQNDAANKKHISDLAKNYHIDIKRIIKEQDKTQKEVAFYISELKKAGASDQEIAAYIKKNIKLKSGEEQLSVSMKKMQENLQDMVQNTKFKTDEDKALAEKQAQTLEKYFKEREKSKAEKWANRKLNTVKEEAGSALKDTLVKGLGAGFQTLLGPLRLIIDPILDLGGTKSLDLFDKIIERSSERESAKNEDLLTRFGDLASAYSEEDEWSTERKKDPKSRKEKSDESKDPINKSQKVGPIEPNRSSLLRNGGIVGASAVFLADSFAMGGEGNPDKITKEKEGSLDAVEHLSSAGFPPENKESVEESPVLFPTDILPEEDTSKPDITAEIPVFPDFFQKREKELGDTIVPNFLAAGAREENERIEKLDETSELFSSIEPTRSDLLKRGGVIGASAVFLADFLTGESNPERSGAEKGDTNFLGIPGGIGGLKGAIAKFLPVAVGNAVAMAIPLAMAAGAIALQKRDTEDSKKYADRGDYGRATETFLLGDRERITEETAGSELGRTTGKFALAGGAVAGGVAAGGFIAGGGAAAAAGAATAAGAGTLGAAGAAGLAALGAVVPPALIAAAIAAAAAAVAKGTQEAYELEYDKNAATIQRDLQRLISDEEAPFLKRVGAEFKSDWVTLTSTLAGGIRGVTEVMDVEAERNVQQQLEILRRQADEGNEKSARIYEMMSQQSFREKTAKEKERLLRSEGLYEEYLDVVSESDNNFWEKLKNGTMAAVKGAEGTLNTVHENMKGTITAKWERLQLANMDKKLTRTEDIDRLKNSEVYQQTMGDTGDPLKAMEEAFLAEQREMAQARGDIDASGMVVDIFDKIKLRLKSFTDISDEVIMQSTEFDTRRLQLLSEGISAEEADRRAMEEQRDILTSQMELRLKQTKEYKKAFDAALDEGKSLKDAEKQALAKVKGNKEYLKSFGEDLGKGLENMWQSTKDFFGTGWDKVKSGGAAAWKSVKGFGGNVWDFLTGNNTPGDVPAINDGIVYKDGKVIKIANDDNIIATKSEPIIGDEETNRAAAVPVMPSIKEFNDINIVSILEQILVVLKEKEFNPTINTGGGDSGMNFDALRTAGAI
jgi:hypothetical protein